MSYQYPSIDDFKSYFFRDFPYGNDVTKNVLDLDIAKAFGQANMNWNNDFWGSQEAFNIGYFYLAAHYLCVDFAASSQGLASTYSWVEQSKSVGNVSQAFAIPQYILDIPEFAMYSQTRYGAKYLSMILPQLAGQTFVVAGTTRP